MTLSKEPGVEPGSFDDELSAETQIAVGEGDINALRQAYEKLHPPVPPTFEERILAERPSVTPSEEIDALLQEVGFKPRHADWIVTHDPIGFTKVISPERIEGSSEAVVAGVKRAVPILTPYLEKGVRERGKGKNEAASYGSAVIDGVEVEVVAMHFDYHAGSMGTVVGEKLIAGTRAAKKYQRPLILIPSSAGVRQEENMLGLDQMPRATREIEKFKESTDLPVIVLTVESWGGIPASIESQADVLLGWAGTNRGFSGPRVIEAFQGLPPRAGSQSIEKAVVDRNVDAIVQSRQEALTWLGRFLNTYKKDPKAKLDPDNLPTLRLGEIKPGQGRIVHMGSQLGEVVVEALLPDNQQPVIGIEATRLNPEDSDMPEADVLMSRYRDIVGSAARLDTETLMNLIFSDVVPMYNHIVREQVGPTGDIEVIKEYPEIIAAIGKIGLQPFLIIGNQPSYILRNHHLSKKHATPDVEDFEYQVRMLEMGERLGLPAIFFTDTLGARPTEDSERRDQPRKIAKAMIAANNYDFLTMTIVIGALGSGGGTATAPMHDYRAALERALLFVAEPYSSAAITTGSAAPDREIVKTLLSTMKASAQDNLELNVLDEVIPEFTNPFQTAVAIHDAIARFYAGHQGLRGSKLERRRNRISRKRKGLPINGDNHTAMLEK